MTTKHGFRFATSVGGSATGEGGDILIIDDPHNLNHIHSPEQRRKVIEWYEQTFATRLNDRSQGAIVIVMQRLHAEDLVGYLTKAKPEGWEVLRIPGIAQQDQVIEAGGRSYTNLLSKKQELWYDATLTRVSLCQWPEVTTS